MEDHGATSDPQGAKPPEQALGAKRRRLSGVSRRALEDLVLCLSLFTSDVLMDSENTRGAAGTLRANLANWARMYL